MNIKTNLKQGFNNFFSLKPVNVFIFACLMLILLLSYINTGKIDLFTDPTTQPQIPVTTPNLITDASTSLLQDFLAGLYGQTYRSNKFEKVLEQRQKTIDSLQQKQESLKNIISEAVGLLNIN